MEDTRIIELFCERDENAIAETTNKYGQKMQAMALRILENKEDAEECVNESLWKVWEAIPKEKPLFLKAYLLKVCRNTALNTIRYRNADKRQGNVQELTAELEQCIPDHMQEFRAEGRELEGCLKRFLEGLPKEKRQIFMNRYWFGESVADISQKYGISEEKVKTTCFRVRKKLKQYLEKEDFTI